ncbi:hypothetical protein [Metabacillus idriensis]|nr:hypothetical protein [Metabacillus idriensis]
MNYPVLQAFERDKDGMLSAWCPFCARFHHHGKEEGHKVAHCIDGNSPFEKTGYILKKVTYKPSK